MCTLLPLRFGPMSSHRNGGRAASPRYCAATRAGIPAAARRAAPVSLRCRAGAGKRARRGGGGASGWERGAVLWGGEVGMEAEGLSACRRSSRK